MAVDDAFGVEFGDVGDWGGAVSGEEVDYFLVGAFECYGGVSTWLWVLRGVRTEDDWVGGEDLEVGVEFLGGFREVW